MSHKNVLQFKPLPENIQSIINRLTPVAITTNNPYKLKIYDVEEGTNLNNVDYHTLKIFTCEHKYIIISNGQYIKFESTLEGTLSIINSYFEKGEVAYI